MSPYKLNEQLGQELMYGDVLLPPRAYQRGNHNGAVDIAIREGPRNRWIDNIVPYVISDKYSTKQRLIIDAALNALQQQSCFRFVGRTSETDYLFFDKLDGCYSFVGRIGGRQLLSLAPGCLYEFIIWHEVMHALGFEHEHQRPDRDQYIRVEYRNVNPDKLDNFDKIPSSLVDLHGHAYDYNSIMHYDGTAFGKYDEQSRQKLVTMTPLRDGIQLSDNMKLSDLDLEKLRLIGKCPTNKSFDAKRSVCKDLDANCEEHMKQGMCKDGKYRPMMQDKCAMTCNMCDTAAPEPPTPCTDQARNCPEYVRNGFCENPFYTTQVKKQTCSKSCGYCDSTA